MNIFCVGPTWQGSNAGALFRAFQKNNHVVNIIDECYFISLYNEDMPGKIVAKLIRPHQIKQFNKVILKTAEMFKPDLMVIYKGAFILPETLYDLKEFKFAIVNFFPDVSFTVHGGLIPKTLPLYDYIFTTKTFGIKDLEDNFGLKNSSFIPHGFDEDLHYPHVYDRERFRSFECDLSFIGDRDDKKEKILIDVIEKNRPISFNIWGRPWIESKSVELLNHVMGESIFGDLYPIGIQSSKINLGLLSERRSGASSGDLITSRTFHIPACGGFMIHERTEDVLQYFDEGVDIECFSESTELNDKIKYYLRNEEERNNIRRNGFERCKREHNLKTRAQQIIEILTAKGMVH